MSDWKVIPRPLAPDLHDYVIVDKERVIAQDIERFEDALKMAAAQELLEAAQFAAQIVINSPVDNAIPAYRQLNLAIAKAEGWEDF